MSDAVPTLTLLADGKEYRLLSDSEGSHFILRFKTDRMSAHLHGEDAARFRADYQTVTTQFPASQPDQMLAQLWDQGGYSWLAVEDGGDDGDAR